MVKSMELTYDEMVDTLDGNVLLDQLMDIHSHPVFTDINLMIKSLFLNEVTVDITNDDIRLRAFLTTNKTIRFTKNLSSIEY